MEFQIKRQPYGNQLTRPKIGTQTKAALKHPIQSD